MEFLREAREGGRREFAAEFAACVKGGFSGAGCGLNSAGNLG